jgi:hypothetical protein
MHRLIAVIVGVSWLLPSVAAPAPAIQRGGANARISVFVGPQTREGFVDVDQGVLDSIKDLKGELRGKTRFSVVEAREDARLVLEVVSRGMTSTNGGGTVGMPVGTSTYFIPVGTIGIATMLRVGTYEKPIVFQKCGTWRHCAQLVAKDVETWVEANASLLEK